MKEMKMTQMNGKLSYVHVSEELSLLKHSHYPKQPTELMQSLSKFQWHFSQKCFKNSKICVKLQKTMSSQRTIKPGTSNFLI